jgi:hypothetical protein
MPDGDINQWVCTALLTWIIRCDVKVGGKRIQTSFSTVVTGAKEYDQTEDEKFRHNELILISSIR